MQKMHMGLKNASALLFKLFSEYIQRWPEVQIIPSIVYSVT